MEIPPQYVPGLRVVTVLFLLKHNPPVLVPSQRYLESQGLTREERGEQVATEGIVTPAYGFGVAAAVVIGGTAVPPLQVEPETLVQLLVQLDGEEQLATMLAPPTALTFPPRILLVSIRLIAALPALPK